jgi:negative regulator of sigma E activity
MGVADFLVWFSRNPALALHIKKEEAKLKMKRFIISSERAEKHKQVLEEKRRRYPGELPKLTLGASLVLILLAFSLYLVLYLLMEH